MFGHTANSRFKAEVVGQCIGVPPFTRISTDEIEQLYDICNDEAEAFDGEEVSSDYMIVRMSLRFLKYGLQPSRN